MTQGAGFSSTPSEGEAGLKSPGLPTSCLESFHSSAPGASLSLWTLNPLDPGKKPVCELNTRVFISKGSPYLPWYFVLGT